MAYEEIIKNLVSCKKIMAVALGGSRSRGEYIETSDYDLFCVVNDEDFECFRKTFVDFLECIPSVQYAAEVFYLENWGYLFKAMDSNRIFYDISIISKNRMKEMSIRSTNKIIKDTDMIYQHCVEQADDDSFMIARLECDRFRDYGTLYGFERIRFLQAIEKKDYWYAVRCLERMKNYLIRCERIESGDFPKSRSCPEKGYGDIDDCLKRIYTMDGNLNTLVLTSERLYELFQKIIKDDDVRRRSQLDVGN